MAQNVTSNTSGVVTTCAFAYEETEIEPGLTLAEWRRARRTPQRPAWWVRLLRRA